MAKWLCQSVYNSEGAFSLIFDETATNQRQKQMDLLHFWDKNTNHIVTKYLGLLYFGRATVAGLTSIVTDVMDSDEYDIPWERLFYVSSDGPNINKAVWRNLNKKSKDKGCKGLVPLIVCTLGTMHNAFRKGTSVGGFGEMAERLTFDLHALFKVYFCYSVIVQPVDFAVELCFDTKFKVCVPFYPRKALQKL